MKIAYILLGIASAAALAFGINYMLKKQKTGIEAIDKINNSVTVQIDGVKKDYQLKPKGTTEAENGYSLLFNPESVELIKGGKKIDRMTIGV